MIKDLAVVFGSLSKAQEVLLLLHNAKLVVRQGFYQHELPAVERFCRNNNLHFVTSKFKILLADAAAYSNKGIRIPLMDPRAGMQFVYLSKDETQAHLAAYYELINDVSSFGRILGYPSCCIDFFVTSFSDQNTNLELVPTNPWTNLTKRKEDAVLLSHFPCSSECTESITLAKQYLHIIKDIDPQRAMELLNFLTL